MTQPSLMILGGDHRNALGIIRTFGRAGIPVFVGGSHGTSYCGFSRYASQRFTYPSPEADLEAAHAVVMEKIEQWRPDVLLPAMDDGWRLVYTYYDLYESQTNVVPCPGFKLFTNMTDKSYMTTYAQKQRIPVPASLQPNSLEDAVGLRDELPYPVLLKPTDSVGGAGIRIVHHPQEFNTIMKNYNHPPIIQELIEGEDLELTLLFNHGDPLAGSVYLSLRNFPLPYGPPIACRTIQDEKVMDLGINLLRSLNYHGVAHLDFRRDQRDGIPKLLDFNVRLAGTNEISLRSGVDFGFMLYQLALGEIPAPCFEYEVGLEFRWLLYGELQHLLSTQHKGQTLRELCRWHMVNTNVSLIDPLPHLGHLLSYMQSDSRALSSTERPTA